MAWGSNKDNKQLSSQEKSQVARKSILGALVAGPLGGLMSGISEKRRIEAEKQRRK
jgi:hypothetical protein